MAKLELTSNITFLYFKDLEKAKHFFSETLGLEVAYDPGWACVYRLKDKAFLGAVDNAQGSIQVDSTSSVLQRLRVLKVWTAFRPLSRLRKWHLSRSSLPDLRVTILK